MRFCVCTTKARCWGLVMKVQMLQGQAMADWELWRWSKGPLMWDSSIFTWILVIKDTFSIWKSMSSTDNVVWALKRVQFFYNVRSSIPELSRRFLLSFLPKAGSLQGWRRWSQKRWVHHCRSVTKSISILGDNKLSAHNFWRYFFFWSHVKAICAY